MFEVLQAHGKLGAIQEGPPEQAWRLLLADDTLGVGPIINRSTRQRNTHHQQQRAPPTGQQPRSLHHQQQQRAPPMGQQPRNLHHQQQHQTTPMEAIADYVIEAWKLRSAALTGRGTNGGDPVV